MAETRWQKLDSQLGLGRKSQFIEQPTNRIVLELTPAQVGVYFRRPGPVFHLPAMGSNTSGRDRSLNPRLIVSGYAGNIQI